MPLPTSMQDLSTTAASNSPAGGDPVGTSLDNYLREIQAIIRRTNAKGADIASAATTDIGAATGEFVTVTGTTTITALGTIDAGIVRTVHFSGSLTLTHNATSLILPGGQNITTAAGDVMSFRSLGSGNWRCVGSVKASNGGVGSPITAPTVAAMKALTGLAAGAAVVTLGYRSIGDGGHGTYDYSASAGTDDGFAVHNQTTGGGSFNLQWDGANAYAIQAGIYTDGTNAATNTTQIQKCIEALRHDGQSILDTIGGSTITAYASGTVHFPAGTIDISAATIEARYDVGLKFKGTGSRRTNNAVRGSTVLRFSGTSSSWILRAYRSGGRGFTVEDMDITYSSSGFTGDVFDVIDAPGTNFKRVYLGSNGVTGGTRLQTAQSLIRSTYDEFMTFEQCTFDGAVDGWWSDDSRTELGNTFGGSVTNFKDCVWYDFTGDMARHDGNRTRTSVTFENCAWNPIGVDCVRSVDMNNVDGLVFTGGLFTPSTTNKASTEWLRLVNCTGSINGVSFNDLTKAGTLNGNLSLRGNVVFCTDGFTLTGGVITAGSNEFSKGTNAYYLDPTGALTVDLGPDLFKSNVTNSYNIPADSTNLAGFIHYDSANDASTNRFSNASGRIQIRNIDEKQFSVSTTPYTVLKQDTGRTIQATGGSNQTFTMPNSIPGTLFKINKQSSVTLTINLDAGDNLYTGTGAAKSSVSVAAGDVGGTITLEAYSTVGWLVTSLTGTWTFS